MHYIVLSLRMQSRHRIANVSVGGYEDDIQWERDKLIEHVKGTQARRADL